jgi:hypothetical protein
MAKWKPLPPMASVTVGFNVQALIPFRRPFGFSAAESLLATPSCSVSSDGEGDCKIYQCSNPCLPRDDERGFEGIG